MKTIITFLGIFLSANVLAESSIKAIWLCESQAISVAIVEDAPYSNIIILAKSSVGYERISPRYTVNSSISGTYYNSSGQNYQNGNWENYNASLQVEPGFIGKANWLVGTAEFSIKGMTCRQNAILDLLNP